jgi:hypothetical protein
MYSLAPTSAHTLSPPDPDGGQFAPVWRHTEIPPIVVSAGRRACCVA